LSIPINDGYIEDFIERDIHSDDLGLILDSDGNIESRPIRRCDQDCVSGVADITDQRIESYAGTRSYNYLRRLNLT
jgi:hypothetical protein